MGDSVSIGTNLPKSRKTHVVEQPRQPLPPVQVPATQKLSHRLPAQRGPLASQVDRAQFIAVALTKPVDGTRRAQSTRPVSVAIPPPENGCFSRSSPLLTADHSLPQDRRPGPFRPSRRHVIETGKTRRRFRRCSIAPAPPGAGKRDGHCLAVASPSSRSLLLAAHSPTTVFESPDRPGRAPVTTPETAVVPALVTAFIPQVTSLEGVTPRVGCRMSPAPARA